MRNESTFIVYRMQIIELQRYQITVEFDFALEFEFVPVNLQKVQFHHKYCIDIRPSHWRTGYHD